MKHLWLNLAMLPASLKRHRDSYDKHPISFTRLHLALGISFVIFDILMVLGAAVVMGLLVVSLSTIIVTSVVIVSWGVGCAFGLVIQYSDPLSKQFMITFYLALGVPLPREEIASVVGNLFSGIFLAFLAARLGWTGLGLIPFTRLWLKHHIEK